MMTNREGWFTWALIALLILCAIIAELLVYNEARAHSLTEGLTYEQLINGFQLPEWWKLWCWSKTDCWT